MYAVESGLLAFDRLLLKSPKIRGKKQQERIVFCGNGQGVIS
jgi:hypothetical protein